MFSLKKIVSLVILLGIVIVMAGMVLLQKPAPVAPPLKPEIPSETPETPSPKIETPIKVSVAELLEEYKNNPVAANEKYKDRIILTMGEVIYIEDKEKGADVWISFPNPYGVSPIPYGPAIVCSFSDKKEAVSIKKGEVIAVSGKNKGKGETLLLYFEDCHLLKIEELKEFKAEFEKETGNLRIINFGYDLVVKLKSPKGKLLSVTSVEYFKTSAIIEKLPHLILFFHDPKPGDYSVVIMERIRLDGEKYDEKLLYEEKFSVWGPEKAKMEIEIQGNWTYGEKYKIKEINITFANPEKIPIIVQAPVIEVYKDDKKLCSFGSFLPASLTNNILLPGEEVSFVVHPIGIVEPEPVTTDTRGGEYQLTLKIYIFEEKIKELEVTVKVPPKT